MTTTTPPPAETVAEILGERFTRIRGRVVPYDQPENIGGLFYEQFRYGAFTESLARVDGSIPLLPFHRSDMLPVGRSIDWEERRDGLYGTFEVDDSPFAQEVARSCRDQFTTGLSVGFTPEQSVWSYVDVWDPDNGQLDSVTRTKARLFEVSITPTPAYAGALVLEVEAEARSEQARSLLRGAQYGLRARQMLRDLDQQSAARAASRVELEQWRRWLKRRADRQATAHRRQPKRYPQAEVGTSGKRPAIPCIRITTFHTAEDTSRRSMISRAR